MPDLGLIRFRRSPHLVCYWSGGAFVLQNYATGVRAGAHPLTCELLDFFERWRPANDLFREKPSIPRRRLGALISLLVRGTFLHQDGRAVPPSEHAMDAWASWNPAAGFFHAATRDVPYMEAEIAEANLRRTRRGPKPASVKRYPRAHVVRLPDPHGQGSGDGGFVQVLRARRTWRRFARSPIQLASLSTLLKLSAGIERWAIVPGEGRAPLKTSPSGGARHPIEAYVLALNVAGLARGLYHYAADRHELNRLTSGARRSQVERYLPQQWWYRPAGALLILTAVFPRSLWRYDYARAYRAVFVEAGHVCQTFCLTATWLGLAPFCSMALADSRIEKDLGIDGVTESVVYMAGVGTRPPNSSWAPSPDPADVPKTRPPNRGR